MFGKSISEYLAFQKVVLILLVAVGLARLGLSLAGAPRPLVVWMSMNLVGWTGALWYGVSARRRGWSYRQLLPPALFQAAVFHAIAVLGILLTIAGTPNVYAAPEFSGPAAENQWLHATVHLTIGMVAASLLWWAGGSVSLFLSRRMSRA